MAGSDSSQQEALIGLLSGAAFGAVSPLVGHPFDTVKTRMQADSHHMGSSVGQTVRTIWTQEGPRGFYRGFIPMLTGSMAYRGILFSAYSGAFAACEHVPVLHEPIPYTGGLRSSVLVGAMAAAVARATIESPLDFMKVRKQVGKEALQGMSDKSSGGGVAKNGTNPLLLIRHLYSGYLPTLFRTMGLLGSFFVMVDYSVRYIPDVINAPLIGPFFKGGVCATAAWCFAFPFETAKSVIQSDTTGQYRQMRYATWKVMTEIYRTKGIRGLYRGFGPGASRSFVANGTSMIVYAWFQDAIRTRDES